MIMASQPMLLCLLYWILVPLVCASNILIYPFTGEGSHYSVMYNVAKELTVRGHTITMLVGDIFEDKVLKSTGVDEERIEFIFHKTCLTYDERIGAIGNMTNAMLEGRYREWMMEVSSTDFFKKYEKECVTVLGDEEFMSNLQNFDLSVGDNNHDCSVVQYLRLKYGIKFVSVSAILGVPSIDSITKRIPFNPSYMPETSSTLDHVMTFSDRLKNVATSFTILVVFTLLNMPKYETRKEFGITETSPYYEDAELFLINTDFALDFARPLLPNAIPVGGLTTKPKRPLSAEWTEFLESAGEDGVVLFSMGSYATGIDENVAGLFAGAFAQLPQKVIWKLNGKPSATLTPNVKVVDWIPQNDLLGHPQIKAFVYHCGMNGVWEAVYHGVPMVAVPLFGDQYDNAQRLVSRDMAVKVDITTLTSDELAQAIRTVISDPSFKNNATRISAIFRDSPRTPVEVAADWIEYVIRHGGAKHLRSAALDLNIFQYLLLDVIAVLLLAFITFMIILYCSCRLCFRGCRRLCGSSKVKTE
ncbi:UDP-glucuronosyltransferase 2A1-like [Amphiura filiformis]|uniref:UDP-glucuronosyltransferase 2A1-like n=1 Tax=Amphiura filiformis TaxID=82378 RepID=UPI003B21D1D1